MAVQSAEHVRNHLKVYIFTFICLAVLTVVTVAVASLQLTIAAGIVLALIIAAIKGSLVASNFMHLIEEKPIILGLLVLAGFFFIVMMILPLIAYYDPITIK